MKKSVSALFFLFISKKNSNFVPDLGIMKRNASLFIVLSVLLVLLFCLDVCSGSMWLWPWGELSPMEQNILHAIRLPKAITAVLAGASLSVAGLILQTLFRNPLASPYTLGVSSGASLGVAILTMCSATMVMMLPLAACIGALMVLLLVLAVSSSMEQEPLM